MEAILRRVFVHLLFKFDFAFPAKLSRYSPDDKERLEHLSAGRNTIQEVDSVRPEPLAARIRIAAEISEVSCKFGNEFLSAQLDLRSYSFSFH